MTWRNRGPRVALLAIAAVAMAGFVAVRSGPPQHAGLATVPSRTVAIRADRVPDVRIPTLHDRARAMAAPIQRRNLFAYRAKTSVASRSAAPPRRVADVGAVPAAEVDRVVLTLIGVAEDTGAAGLVRTAIITSPDQLFLVTQGETLSKQYRVSAIASDSAALVNLVTGATRRLALR